MHKGYGPRFPWKRVVAYESLSMWCSISLFTILFLITYHYIQASSDGRSWDLFEVAKQCIGSIIGIAKLIGASGITFYLNLSASGRKYVHSNGNVYSKDRTEVRSDTDTTYKCNRMIAVGTLKDHFFPSFTVDSWGVGFKRNWPSLRYSRSAVLEGLRAQALRRKACGNHLRQRKCQLPKEILKRQPLRTHDPKWV